MGETTTCFGKKDPTAPGQRRCRWRKVSGGKCFLKFAYDDKGIYGSDEKAQKAAANEIRAANALLQCGMPTLHVSMSALHYWQGHCVIATALMPIGEDTLVYGSNDAYRTIHDSDPQIREMIEHVAEKLNLAPHRLVDKKGQEFNLCIAGDCEGHLGRDGRY